MFLEFLRTGARDDGGSPQMASGTPIAIRMAERVFTVALIID
jgi:hypothetical protein